MAHLFAPPRAQRHARLFELIRQENIRRETRFAAPQQSQPSLTDIQIFLQRANRSFSPDGVTRILD